MNSSISDIAKQMMADPKGLLAADESSRTCQKRFDALKIDCTDESRRQWRQLLCMSPNIELYISGVILYDETIRQKTDEGLTFADALTKKGIIPGIKVDMGLVPMDNFEPATITEGLDGLSARLNEYYEMGVTPLLPSLPIWYRLLSQKSCMRVITLLSSPQKRLKRL
jgi:fructose-bisphosphate aldolase class I